MLDPQIKDRRTSVDTVFEYLYNEISLLRLLPGDKISEADIASRFGISRQPVRDAFSRLANLDLLLIRPQRATEVRRFSIKEITKSRFVRAAIEVEVLRRAAGACDRAGAEKLDSSLKKQRSVKIEKDFKKFTVLDREFHQCLCEIGEVAFAFEVISTEKAKIDRLCILEMTRASYMNELIADHTAIAKAVKQGHAEEAVKLGIKHLSRMDDTIKKAQENNATYFEE